MPDNLRTHMVRAILATSASVLVENLSVYDPAVSMFRVLARVLA